MQSERHIGKYEFIYVRPSERYHFNEEIGVLHRYPDDGLSLRFSELQLQQSLLESRRGGGKILPATFDMSAGRVRCGIISTGPPIHEAFVPSIGGDDVDEVLIHKDYAAWRSRPRHQQFATGD